MATKLAILVLVCLAALTVAMPPAGGRGLRTRPRSLVSANVRTLQQFRRSVAPRPPTTRVDNCGRSAIRAGGSQRIVGGQQVVPHSYPWQVSLYIDASFFCSGNIISKDWILATALCLDGASFVEVIAGAHNVYIVEPSQVIQMSTAITVNENWDYATFNYDLALIRVPTPYTWTNEISPICLPSYSAAELRAGEKVTLTGWGSVTTGGYMSEVLRKVEVAVDEKEDCQGSYGTAVVTDLIICTETLGGVGICTGDAGGPMNYVVDGVTYVRGLNSFGSAAGCGTGYPDGFTRVAKFLTWIEIHTGIVIAP